MANLTKVNETRQFIYEWQQYDLEREHRTRGQRFINDAAKEQRANLEAVKRNGHGGWCTIEEYEQSVQMLESATHT